MSLHARHLNLVPILRALLREKNVSRVARDLNTTQPAVSGALARLRESLGDPILVRVGRRMELTPYAIQLQPQVEKLCSTLESIWARPAFDPLHGRRTFRIASPDYGPLVVGTSMINSMQAQAPEVSMTFMDLSAAAVGPLQSGKIDFLIASRRWFDWLNFPALQTITLFDDEFVAVVAHNHPLARLKTATEADYAAQRYIIFDPDFDGPQGSDSAHPEYPQNILRGFKGGERVVARVKQFNVLPQMAAQTGCVAIAPRRMVEKHLNFLPVRILDKQFPTTRFEICLSWAAIHDFDPAHRWFRTLLQNTLGAESQTAAVMSGNKKLN